MPLRKNRRFERRTFERIGALEIGAASAACEIIDISQGGARLRPVIVAPEAVPNTFTLLLSSCGRVRRICRVAWRSKVELGVQFAKPEGAE